MNLIGVPKTIDNDLAATEVSIGFQTAVDVATDALTRLKSTAESHDRIMLLEVMGRDAGHIALHAGIAGGANAILIPEIPFVYESIVRKIEERKAMGRYFSIVVVAEGAFEQGSQPIYKQATTAKFATQHLGGIGAIVAEKLHALTDMDTRITVLGHIQRGGNPTPYDRVLASTLGARAVDLAHAKRFGIVVGLNDGQLTETPYAKVMDISRPLNLESMFVKTAEAIGICLGR
jgi:6-phosphofructokinase 1